jgi:hypothetical protein
MADQADNLASNTESVGNSDKVFATWCVMDHARPVIIHALRRWKLMEAADVLENAPSLAALRAGTQYADAQIKRRIAFTPVRRNLSNAVRTLQAAATFATRGDAVNASALVIAVFTSSASAIAWRRPWTRLRWQKERGEVIARARQEQALHRAQT